MLKIILREIALNHKGEENEFRWTNVTLWWKTSNHTRITRLPMIFRCYGKDLERWGADLLCPNCSPVRINYDRTVI